MLKRAINASRFFLRNQSSWLTRPLGFSIIDKAETYRLLTEFVVYDDAGQCIDLPEVPNAGTNDVLYPEVTVRSTQTKIWRYNNQSNKASLSRSGILKIGFHVLNTDFGTNAFYRDFVTVYKRRHYNTDILIAPWSHAWGGYYDFLFYTLAKLCRIREVLGDAEFDKALISYPLQNTPFEAEYFDLLRFKRSNIVDSRLSKIHFKSCVFGNNDEWFHPSYQSIISLRKQILDEIPPYTGPRKRLYIRRAGRRKITNEDALIQLLLIYGFEIVHDVTRTIHEQIELYRSASFIIGPHGASFSNILWCEPSTHLMELFGSQYTPGFYRYLAGVLSISYSAYCSGSFDKPSHENMGADINVSIDTIEKALSTLLKPVSRSE